MIEKLTPQEIKTALTELLEWDALEMQIRQNADDKTEVLIPYLMNDASECFFRLTDTVVHGRLPEKCPENAADFTEIELLDSSDRRGILIRQKGNTVSIWYREARKERHCYQYHRIGHNWRKSREGEHIRRLVNLLCVLSDKHSYLDPEACNHYEQKLWPLIEFAPLCAWSPITDSLQDWYPETEEGIQAMTDLVKDLGDKEYLKVLEAYQKETNSSAQSPSRKKQKLEKILTDLLDHPDHACIWKEIEKRLIQASLCWEARTYAKIQTEQMEYQRKQKEKEYLKKGYTGSYPRMTLDTKSGKKEVFFVEEHPFTLLEWEDYQFRVYEVFRQIQQK